jgi:large subunit ribosomal protein L10
MRASRIFETPRNDMNRDQKAATIDEIAGEIESAQAIFAVDYRGISVPQAAELRVKLRDADASFRVVKNSLTERAADKAGAEQLKELLAGPTALTFVRGDAALAAKAVADYARATSLLPFKGGVMDGQPVSAQEIGQIARLPARDVLYGQLVGLVASPIGGLVRSLNALIGGLAIALGQVAEQRGGEAVAAPSESPADEAPAAPSESPAIESTPAEDDSPSGDSTGTAESASPGQEAEAGEAVVADEAAAEAPADEAQAADETAAEAPAAEASAETAEEPAAEAPAAEDKTEPEPQSAPDENDNQADASAEADQNAAEAKEDQ